MKKIILCIALASMAVLEVSAQTFADVSVGTSHRDQAFLNLALRHQFSERFRAGIEAQSGLIDYRFIGGKLIEEGNATTLGIPLTWRILEDSRLRLDLYARAGVTFQSVPTADAERRMLESSSSFLYSFEPGLIVSLPLSEKMNLQGGFTIPLIFEASPVGLFENNVSNLFLNMGYQLSAKSILFLKTNTGPAAGANGDSHKYTWSVQAGVRILLNGQMQNGALLIEPTY